MSGRLALLMSAAGLQLVAALVALGRPDPEVALGFWRSSAPTAAESLAAAQLLVWGLVALTLTIGTGLALAEALSSAPLRHRLWEGSVLILGLLLLAAGAGRHLTHEPSFAGGTVQEAQQALGP